MGSIQMERFEKKAPGKFDVILYSLLSMVLQVAIFYGLYWVVLEYGDLEDTLLMNFVITILLLIISDALSFLIGAYVANIIAKRMGYKSNKKRNAKKGRDVAEYLIHLILRTVSYVFGLVIKTDEVLNPVFEGFSLFLSFLLIAIGSKLIAFYLASKITS
jgi:small-conductance mechanosensitive channel